MKRARREGRRAVGRRLGILAAVYYAVLSLLSQIPGEDLDALGFDISDKLAHFAAFVPLGLLLSLALALGFSRSTRTGRWFAAASCAALVLGAIDEFHQVFVPGRRPDVLDAIADGLGGGTGGGVAAVILRGRGLLFLLLGLEPLDELETEEQEEPVEVLAGDPVGLHDGRDGEQAR